MNKRYDREFQEMCKMVFGFPLYLVYWAFLGVVWVARKAAGFFVETRETEQEPPVVATQVATARVEDIYFDETPRSIIAVPATEDDEYPVVASAVYPHVLVGETVYADDVMHTVEYTPTLLLTYNPEPRYEKRGSRWVQSTEGTHRKVMSGKRVRYVV